MAEAASRLYVPALGGLYSAVNEYAEPILRIGVGAILIPHGMQKLFGMKSRPKPRTMVRLAETWRPYRSIACWYLWRI